MEIKGHDKVRTRADNAMKFSATMIVANKEELLKEEDVLKQLDALMNKEVKELEQLRIVADNNPDNDKLVGNYKIKENRVKEIATARELSEEAVLQFKMNLTNLGEKGYE